MNEEALELEVIHRPPGGQAILYQTENRYLSLLESRFGQPFVDYRKAWAQASARSKVGSFPLSLDLAVNSGCNLSCLMCPLPSLPQDRQYAPMAEGLYLDLMAQARAYSLPALTLGLASEPLLNPNLCRYIALADRAGIMDIRLGTNGQALNAFLIDSLLESGLTRLEISVDAARAETYRQIRPGGRLSQVEWAANYFLEQRAKKNIKLPLLRLSFLKLPQNNGELEPFLKKWQSQVDLISVQTPIWFPGSKLEQMPPKLSETTAPSQEDGYCLQPWQRLGLDRLGRVWPCCNWYGRELLSLSAQDLKISNIWQSESLNNLRKSHLSNNLPPLCRTCAQSGAF
jgi:hypothetical protein